MKSFVQSMYLFTTAIGAALSEAFVPATGDPDIMWMYTGIGVGAVATAGVFWFLFHEYDDQEEELNRLDAHDTWGGKPGEESDGETTKSEAHQQHPSTTI